MSGNKRAWPDVCGRLNRLLIGWSATFGYGARLAAYKAVDRHVWETVRGFLAKRHKQPGRGTRRFSQDKVFGELGVQRLQSRRLGPTPVCLAMKPVSRMRKIRTSGLLRGEGKRGLAAGPATAPFLEPTAMTSPA
ncbi:MAG: group II intron maturase-specific domain-containing protein [Methylocella sp.]